MKPHQRIIPIRNRTLVACLLAAGAKLDPSGGISAIVGDRQENCWNFLERTEDGTEVLKLKSYFETHKDRDMRYWSELDPPTPYAAAMRAILTRIWVSAQDKARKPCVLIERGPSIAILNDQLTPEQEARILTNIGE